MSPRPPSPAARASLRSAAVHWRDGQLGAAIERLEEAASSAEALPVMLASRALAGLGAAGAALAAAERALAVAVTGAEKALASRWKLTLQLGLGDLHGAHAALANWSGDDPGFASLAARTLLWMEDAGGAARLARRHTAVGPLVLGQALERAGDAAGAREAFRAALKDGEASREAAEGLLRLGDVDGAAELPELAAEISAWKGAASDLERAEPARAARIRAACALAAGDLESAARHLESTDAADAVAALLAGELKLRRGDPGAAESITAAGNLVSLRGEWVAQQALLALANRAPELSQMEALAAALDRFEPGWRARSRPLDAVEKLCAALGPNRTTFPYVKEGGALRLLEVPPSARGESIRTQAQLRWRAAGEVLAAFGELAASSSSLHPLLYQGEVFAWVGRWAEAEACFERPVSADMRWAPIGMASVAACRGETPAARRWLQRAAAHPAGPGPTWHAWDAEVLVLEGRHSDARTRLEQALALSPSRVGLRVTLAWLLARHAPATEAAAAFQALCAEAPLLLARASSGTPPPLLPPAERAAVLERAHAMLLANRSASTPTFVDGGGLFFLAPLEEWRKVVRLDAAHFAALVERAS